jgi:CCR4-NOT transcription complex subunit 1
VKAADLLKECWDSIASALSYCVEGNAMVLKYDMKKYFDVMVGIIPMLCDDDELIGGFAVLLHQMRPLIMPLFTFGWIQLATERHFVYEMLKKEGGQPDIMMTILCDFLSAVVYVAGNFSVFDRLYKAILRFILFLAHDFPDFLSDYALEIVVLIPTSLTQLRNIVLSVCPSSVILPVPSKVFPDTSGIDIFSSVQQPLKNLVEQLGFAEIIENGDFSIEAVNQLLKPESGAGLTAFMTFLGNEMASKMDVSEIIDDMENHSAYGIILRLLEKTNGNPEVILLVINGLLDQLRFPCRVTVFFLKILLILFKMENGKLEISELILRAVMERAVTPRPHPWGLQVFVREVIENPEVGLWDCPFVIGSDVVRRFLEATAAAFGLNKV